MLSKNSVEDVDRLIRSLPYIEVEKVTDTPGLIRSVLSGQTAILSSSFPRGAVLIDARTYPARSTSEPDSDRVMQGARDGFVETLVMNTALIRRRIRDPRLTMRHFNTGGASGTDVVMCYMDGVADEKLVADIAEKIEQIRPRGMCLGYQSLSESLIRKGWLNPFPKIRTTERPDTAAAQVLEGSVLIICDTTPQVMILPTSIFDFIQQTDDYYFPPLTGTYLRLVRTAILLLSVIVTPLWYLYLEYADSLPDYLRFLIPDDPGALPIILQLILVELAIDGLKIASMNTPDMLSNSLSVVGALILGDFAVGVGWLCEDVILYMAFVAIANFAQQNVELGYSFKYMRVLTLLLVYTFGIWGFVLGGLAFIFLVCGNVTVSGKRHYLYPLIPFNMKAMLHLLFRMKKDDFAEKDKSDKTYR
jgi:stage V sporulation protein AF